MTKYIIGEIFSSGRATLYKNPSDQTVGYQRPANIYIFWNANLRSVICLVSFPSTFVTSYKESLIFNEVLVCLELNKYTASKKNITEWHLHGSSFKTACFLIP